MRFHFLDGPINTITAAANNEAIADQNKAETTAVCAEAMSEATTKKRRRLLRWKWFDDDSDKEKDEAKKYVLKYIQNHFINNKTDNCDMHEDQVPDAIDGIMGIGQGGELVDHLCQEFERNNQITEAIPCNFGVRLHFYKPTPGNDKKESDVDVDVKTYVPPPDVIEKQYRENKSSLYVPVPANSSHLKDPNVIQTLRQYFSKVLFKK